MDANIHPEIIKTYLGLLKSELKNDIDCWMEKDIIPNPKYLIVNLIKDGKRIKNLEIKTYLDEKTLHLLQKGLKTPVITTKLLKENTSFYDSENVTTYSLCKGLNKWKDYKNIILLGHQDVNDYDAINNSLLGKATKELDMVFENTKLGYRMWEKKDTYIHQMCKSEDRLNKELMKAFVELETMNEYQAINRLRYLSWKDDLIVNVQERMAITCGCSFSEELTKLYRIITMEIDDFMSLIKDLIENTNSSDYIYVTKAGIEKKLIEKNLLFAGYKNQKIQSVKEKIRIYGF